MKIGLISFRPLLFFLPFSISFCFRWFRFAFVGFVLFRFHFVDFVSFRFCWFRFVSFRFVSFRFRWFRFVSFLFRFALYRYPRQHSSEKKKRQMDKQRSTKHVHKTKDRVTWTPFNLPFESKWVYHPFLVASVLLISLVFYVVLFCPVSCVPSVVSVCWLSILYFPFGFL